MSLILISRSMLVPNMLVTITILDINLNTGLGNNSHNCKSKQRENTPICLFRFFKRHLLKS